MFGFVSIVLYFLNGTGAGGGRSVLVIFVTSAPSDSGSS